MSQKHRQADSAQVPLASHVTAFTGDGRSGAPTRELEDQVLRLRAEMESSKASAASLTEELARVRTQLAAARQALTDELNQRRRTEEAQEEQRWQLECILDGTRAGTWEWNIQTGDLRLNETWAQIIGYNLEELKPLSVKTWESLTHADDLKDAWDTVQRHFSGELSYYDCDFRMRHKNGKWVWIHGRGRLMMRDAEGQPLRMFGTHTDITARKESEAQLHSLAEALERKNQELESLIYATSHDLRTPLVTVQGYSLRFQKLAAELQEVVSPLALSDSARQTVDQIVQSHIPKALGFVMAGVERMDALVSGLLRLSRLGRVALQMEKLDLNQLLQKILNAAAFPLQQTDADILVDPLPPCQGDADLISQVFMNLLDNALKYRDPGRRLTLRIRGHRDGERVKVTVEDNGVGMAPGELDKIWEPFYRAPQSRAIAGDGLGLSFVRRIVERHQGEIRAESTPGQGTRFLIFLPAATAP